MIDWSAENRNALIFRICEIEICGHYYTISRCWFIRRLTRDTPTPSSWNWGRHFCMKSWIFTKPTEMMFLPCHAWPSILFTPPFFYLKPWSAPDFNTTVIYAVFNSAFNEGMKCYRVWVFLLYDLSVNSVNENWILILKAYMIDCYWLLH